MSDRDLVTALRAGDRLAAGQVYDVYGTRLYAYCHELLADPKLAADALRDTFIVAANRIRELAEPDEFGAWLYALARAECVRVGISDDAPTDAASAARGDRLARLALDVYSMLEPEERELLDLAFRHRLVDADLGLVLGKDESAVAVEVTRAQADLETALLVVLAARTGDPRCEEGAEAGRRFDEIDGKGIPVWLQTATKHVEKCAICGDAIRTRRPLRLFEELPHAFMPPGVRSRVLEALRDPAGAAFAEQIVERSGKFDEAGFPVSGGGRGAPHLRKWVLPSAGLLAVAACAALVMFMTNDHPAASADVTTTTSVTSGSPSAATASFNELTASSASASGSASASASTSATTSVTQVTNPASANNQQTFPQNAGSSSSAVKTSTPPVVTHSTPAPPPTKPSTTPPTSTSTATATATGSGTATGSSTATATDTSTSSP